MKLYIFHLLSPTDSDTLLCILYITASQNTDLQTCGSQCAIGQNFVGMFVYVELIFLLLNVNLLKIVHFQNPFTLAKLQFPVYK